MPPAVAPVRGGLHVPAQIFYSFVFQKFPTAFTYLPVKKRIFPSLPLFFPNRKLRKAGS
jgi:hypothetical protein